MGSEAAGGTAGGGVSAASAFNPATSSVPSTSATSTASGHVHAGTVSAAEQLAATLGSTISVFNQFFGGYAINLFCFKKYFVKDTWHPILFFFSLTKYFVSEQKNS